MNKRLVVILTALLVTSGLLSVLWKKKTIQDAVERQLLQTYLHYLADKTPVDLVSVDIDSEFDAIHQGELLDIELVLKWRQIEFKTIGPLKIDFDDPWKEIRFEYQFDLVVAGLKPIQSELALTYSPQKNRVLRIDSTLHADQLTLKKGVPQNLDLPLDEIELNQLFFHGTWYEKHLEANLKLSEGLFFWAKGEKALSISGLRLSIRGDDKDTKADLHASQGSYLQGLDTYELPLNQLPLSIELQQKQENYAAQMSTPGIQIDFPKIDTQRPLPLEVKWNASALPFIPWIKSLAPGTKIRGKIQTHGKALITQDKINSRYSGQINLINIDYQSSTSPISIKGLNAEVPLNPHPKQAKASIANFAFRRHQGHLPSTFFTFQADGPFLTAEFSHGIPIELKGVPIQIGPTMIELDGSTNEFDYGIRSSLKLNSVPASNLLKPLCIDAQLIPPARITADITSIEIDPEWIDIDGFLRSDLFQGKVLIEELALGQYRSQAPELDLSFSWKEIQLQSLAEWLHFGDMDGELRGHARDIRLVGLVPLQYDLLIDFKPPFSSLGVRKKKMSFSPKAMENFVKVFGNDAYSQLPDIARLLAFGWPRSLFGRYDVWWAGLKLDSSEGLIVLETLDPPWFRKKTKKEHYLLYAKPGFSMPLESKNYPLVLHATTVANYVNHVGGVIENLIKANRKNEPEGESDASPTHCQQPNQF